MYERISRVTRFLLLLGIVVYLSLPIFDFIFNAPQKPVLNGSYIIYEKPIASVSMWFEGMLQSNFEHYFNQQFRYQAFFIELNNQFLFSCFKETKTSNTDVGKQNYLFGTKYFNAYRGKDFLGLSVLQEKVKQLKIIQDQLKLQQIDLVIVLAPSKTRFYPEYLPDYYSNETISVCNYDYIKRAFKSNQINHIDFNNWFINLKPSFPPSALITKYGIHWSEYGSILATDSLFRYLTLKKNLPPFSIVIDSLEMTTQFRGEDYDIAFGLNLLWQLEDRYYYPSYHFLNDSSLKSLSLLAIGDSFYWNAYNLIEQKNLFKKHEYWYYGKEIYPTSGNSKPLTIKPENVRQKLRQYDVVILIIGEHNLKNLPFNLDELTR